METSEELKFLRHNFYEIRNEVESLLQDDKKTGCLKSIEYHDCPGRNDDISSTTVLSCEFNILQGDRMREITDGCENIELSDEFFFMIFEYNPDTHKFEFNLKKT